MFIWSASAKLFKQLRDENMYLKTQLRDAQERLDRMTEALAAKAGVTLTMPVHRDQPLEPAIGWFDTKPVVKSRPESARMPSGGTT